jgi:hypothetical protein
MSLPTPEEIYLTHPLYEPIEFDEAHTEHGYAVKYFSGTMDSYCPVCGSHSIFERIPQSTPADPDAWVVDQLFDVVFKCTRERGNKDHQLYFLFRVKGRNIEKIGQFPSLAELSLYDVKQYSKALDKKYFKELTRAIGLAAHGVGVGSFVYLRRIFESLIELAHQEATSAPTWTEADYLKARMSEKIELLKSHLPAFLVENRAMYGILSKGIHELTEEECLNAFPVLKVGIEIILDAKLRQLEEQRKIEGARKALQRLAGTHGA